MQTLANNFGTFAAAMPPLLNSIDLIHRIVGPKPLEFISRNLNKMSGNIIPVWSPSIPKVFPSHFSFPDVGVLIGWPAVKTFTVAYTITWIAQALAHV